MDRIKKIYQDCKFDNEDVILVIENILSKVNSVKISKNEDNEIVISKGKNIFLIDNLADVQHIKINDDEPLYKVYYFSDGINYNKMLKGL